MYLSSLRFIDDIKINTMIDPKLKCLQENKNGSYPENCLKIPWFLIKGFRDKAYLSSLRFVIDTQIDTMIDPKLKCLQENKNGTYSEHCMKIPYFCYKKRLQG